MAELTLVPAGLARTGYRFTFMGDADDEACHGCPVRQVCFRLEAGRRYEVVEVRDVRHPCGLHDEDKVAVCKVEPVAFTSTVETKSLRGTAVTWKPIPCGFPECPNNPICHPTGLPSGRHVVDKEHGALECPMHYQLTRVTMRRL